MTKIFGCELDIEKSSDGTNDFQWYLYFTSGEFQGPGVSKTVEPSVLYIDKQDFSNTLPVTRYVYFNPYTNKYSVVSLDELQECNNLGYSLGGFIIVGCRLIFVYPKCDDNKEYIRTFDEKYNEAFNKRQVNCDEIPDVCGAFREEHFSNGYEIDCPVIAEGSEFDYAEFDDSFANIPAD